MSDKSGRFEKVIDRAVAADYQREENEAIKIHDARILTAYEESAGSQEKALAKAIGAEPARAIAAELKSASEKLAQQSAAAKMGIRSTRPTTRSPSSAPRSGARRWRSRCASSSRGSRASRSSIPKTKKKALAEIDKWAKPAFVEGGKKAGPYVPPRRRSKHVTGAPQGFRSGHALDLPPLSERREEDRGRRQSPPSSSPHRDPGGGRGLERGTRLAGIDYWCTNLTDNGLKDMVEESITNDIKQAAYEKRSVSKADLDLIQKTEVALKGKDPKKAEGEEEVKREDTMRQWAPVAAVYLLWVAIFTVAQMLLNNTTEEKTNRVIEVLLSSVTPTELMFGKLVGIAGVGLTMVGAWIGSFLLLLNLCERPRGTSRPRAGWRRWRPPAAGRLRRLFHPRLFVVCGVFLAIREHGELRSRRRRT